MPVATTYWETQARRPELRARGTGGTCTAVLQVALAHGMVRQALVAEPTRHFPWARSAAVSSQAAAAAAAGSKYTLVHHQLSSGASASASGSQAVVTLPCQSARARANGAALVVGLFCGLNIAPAGYRRLLRAHGTRIESVVECDFRSPAGGFSARLADGREIREPRYFWLSYFYPYNMCVRCRDYLNQNADLAIGDRRKEWNSAIAWTEAGRKVLALAADSGAIEARELTATGFHASLMTPYFQKEVLGGYSRHGLIRHRRIVRHLPYPVLKAVGEKLYRRTVAEYRAHDRRDSQDD